MENKRKHRIAIIGAGEAGISIAEEIIKKGIPGEVVCFVDDNASKAGSLINNIPVAGPIDDIKNIQKQYKADEAFIAIPRRFKKQT